MGAPRWSVYAAGSEAPRCFGTVYVTPSGVAAALCHRSPIGLAMALSGRLALRSSAQTSVPSAFKFRRGIVSASGYARSAGPEFGVLFRSSLPD